MAILSNRTIPESAFTLVSVFVAVALSTIGLLFFVRNYVMATPIESSNYRSYIIPLDSQDTRTVIRMTIGDLDFDRDGLDNATEATYGTHMYTSDTDHDGYDDPTEIRYGYDPTGEGRVAMRILINKIGLDAPIIYPKTQKENDIQRALENGTVHYPGTAIPGQEGNSYVTGHSSDYIWRAGNYKQVFRELRQLEIGDSFIIVQHLASGHAVKHTYVIYDIRVTEVDDPILWTADKEGSVVTLVTSWPINSTVQRLMVRGALISSP